MADYQPPQDLIDLRRAFNAANRRCQEIVDTLPSGTAIARGEAEISEEQHAELDASRAERLRIVGEINAHPWWSTVANRHAAGIALMTAAKE